LSDHCGTLVLHRRMSSRSCLLDKHRQLCCSYYTLCAYHTGCSCSKAAISWIKDASPMVSRSCAVSASYGSNRDQRNRSELFGSEEFSFYGALSLRTREWIQVHVPCEVTVSNQTVAQRPLLTDGNLLNCIHVFTFVCSR
jgi:hypothetical protein